MTRGYEIDTAKINLAKFPFDRIKFSVHEDRLVVSLFLKDILLKTWTSYTPVIINSSLTIEGVDGTINLEDCYDL